MISLPKNFSEDKLRQFLLDLIQTLENQINSGPQLYVLDRRRHNQYPRNPHRRDILVRIKQRDGEDKISLYWFDGKHWQPLELSAIDGELDPSQIANFDFLHLTDTPDSYNGKAGQVPVVSALEDGLEFQTVAGVGEEDDCCEILVADGISAPPIMLTNEAEDDFLYSD